MIKISRRAAGCVFASGDLTRALPQRSLRLPDCADKSSMVLRRKQAIQPEWLVFIPAGDQHALLARQRSPCGFNTPVVQRRFQTVEIAGQYPAMNVGISFRLWWTECAVTMSCRPDKRSYPAMFDGGANAPASGFTGILNHFSVKARTFVAGTFARDRR